ncbi:MAG: serine/threonine-protein kinase, partial [Betaproteobacteria bacterium]|nr:serine/threonine-protein kinase [Betaproteobacteria bacterium]
LVRDGEVMEKSVGKYQLNRLLGKGASSAVYLARDTFSGQEVAVKVINPDRFIDTEFGEVYRVQFQREASLAGKLQHPHIVTIYDAVVTEFEGHIAMEYVSGGDLSAYTSADTLLPVGEVIQTGFKCCSALDYAAREGIVHRDIKPANILLTADRMIKIGDFGAAYLQMQGGTQSLTIGSPAYMSPEQISGLKVDFHSDMYSLAVVLYEMLTARKPFVATNLLKLAQQVVYGKPVPLRELRPEIPEALERAVMKALGKQPLDRYATWAEFALELANLGRLSVFKKSVPDSDKFQALRRVVMLKALDDAELWELVHAGRWQRLPPRSTLISERTNGDSLFFLAEGQAKVTQNGRLLHVASAGEWFGEMSYIRGDNAPRQATVESLTEVVIGEFDATALNALRERCQLHFSRALLSTVIERLILADERVAQIIS